MITSAAKIERLFNNTRTKEVTAQSICHETGLGLSSTEGSGDVFANGLCPGRVPVMAVS